MKAQKVALIMDITGQNGSYIAECPLEKGYIVHDITLQFERSAENEKAIIAQNIGDQAPELEVGDGIVQIDPRYYRPTEVETLLSDPTKAKKKLGWAPEIVLDQMIIRIVANDLDQAKQHSLLSKNGFSIAVGRES